MENLPLRIEWELATPWCPPYHGLHLDGLVAWAMVQEAQATGTLPLHYDDILANLPFAKHETKAGWVWQASLLRPVAVLGSERRYMTTKTATAEFAARMHSGGIEGKPLTSIDTVRGPYKNDAFWYTVEHVERIVAYCVGDPERITPLLGTVTHLGKRARLDHGRIAPVEGMLAQIHEDPDALKLWRNRNMPEPQNGHQQVVARLTPPYWLGEGTRIVWRPV